MSGWRPSHSGSRAHGVEPQITHVSQRRCPGCRRPLLAQWGGNCRRCRRPLFEPRSDAWRVGIDAPVDLTLGWLVVLRSEDPTREGQLLELIEPETVIGRNGRAGDGALGHHGFDDPFMSERHAVVSRPTGPGAAFTLREREGRPTHNGTAVNGRRLGRDEQVDLLDGDLVQLGSTELSFRTLSLRG
jgi:hypothetical protein